MDIKFFLRLLTLFLFLNINYAYSQEATEDSTYYNKLKSKFSNTIENFSFSKNQQEIALRNLNNVSDFLDDYLVYIDEDIDGSCVKRSLIIFKSDCKLNIDKILLEIESIIFDDTATNYFSRIEKLQLQIDAINLFIASLNETGIFFKDDSEAGFLESTKQSVASEKSDAQNRIVEINDEIVSLEIDLQDSLREMGINLSILEVRKLTRQLDGEDIVKANTIFYLVKEMSNALGLMMYENSYNLESSKKYYGLYMLLSEVMMFAQREYINNIDNFYMPSIKIIESNSNKSIKLTKKMKSKAESKANREIFNQNIKTEEFNLYVINMLKDELKFQRGKVSRALKSTTERKNLAISSYLTVSNAAGLNAFINDTNEQFNMITSMQIPNIIPFQNKEIEQSYRLLKSRIKN